MSTRIGEGDNLPMREHDEPCRVRLAMDGVVDDTGMDGCTCIARPLTGPELKARVEEVTANMLGKMGTM